MIKQLFKFMMENKKYWLLPPVIVFILFGILLIIASNSPISPFIYTLF